MQLDIFQIPQKEPRRHNACAPASSFKIKTSKPEQVQLDLFTSFKDADDILTEKALQLLEALNEGLKSKQKYQPYAYTQINELMLLVARNQNAFLFNVVDIDGNIPNDFSVNWRNSEHVKQEIYNHLKQKGLLIE